MDIKSRYPKNFFTKLRRRHFAPVKCGICGGRIVRSAGKSNKHVYYICSKISNKGVNTCCLRPIPPKEFKARIKKVIANSNLAKDCIVIYIDESKAIAKERSNINRSLLSTQKRERSPAYKENLERVYNAMHLAAMESVKTSE